MKRQHIVYLLSALTLSSCGNESGTSGKTDSVAVVATNMTANDTSRGAKAAPKAADQNLIYTDTDLGEPFFDYDVPNDEYRYLLSERTRDVNYFGSNFKLQPNGNNPIVNPPFYLNLGSINNFITTLSKSFGYDKTRNFAGIKMMYGMNNSGMVLIFSPVVLTLDGNGNVECTVTPSNQYFTTDGNGNTIDASSQVANRTQYYQDNVWIIHPAVSATHIFIDGGFPNGDSKFTIIPIQQILAMYGDNAGVNHASTDKVQFNIGASNLFLNTGNPHNFKVHVIASYNLAVECQDDTHRFKDLAADFTQMCPPACDNTSYIPARLGQNKANPALRLINKLFHKHTAKNTK